MAGYFAELKNNIVQRVVSATEAQWCIDNLGGEWVQTYYNTAGKNYAGVGYTYLPEVDNFTATQPFDSWTLSPDYKWTPPVSYPNDGNIYKWNESLLNWEKIN